MRIPTAILALLIVIPGVAISATRPNVVLILSDDQGWTDYGFMNHPHIETPNLDRLAGEGILYERGYVTAPLCRPSLASLVTGLHPHQTGIRGNDPVGWKSLEEPEAKAAARARMTAPMRNHRSFVRELKSHGYATLQTGKWWEGNPLEHGFDQAMTHGDPRKGGRHGDDGLKIGRNTMQPIYSFVDQASADEPPFFIWFGVFLPHRPHNAPKRLFEKYRDVAPSEPIAWYWANCEWLDETCGQLIDYLKRSGAYGDTLFVYTCDNGWRQDPGRRQQHDNKSKGQPTEMGIRTPIFVTHLRGITPSHDKTSLASTIDIAPTILRACGIAVPTEMTGLDLRDREALRDRNRVFVEVYEHDSSLDNLDDMDHGLQARVVIDGWDKLVKCPDRVELYDLLSDTDDHRDLGMENEKKAFELEAVLKQWLKGTM